jgi:hypothetical protein
MKKTTKKRMNIKTTPKNLIESTSKLTTTTTTTKKRQLQPFKKVKLVKEKLETKINSLLEFMLKSFKFN